MLLKDFSDILPITVCRFAIRQGRFENSANNLRIGTRYIQLLGHLHTQFCRVLFNFLTPLKLRFICGTIILYWLSYRNIESILLEQKI